MATAFQTNAFQSNAFELTVYLLSLTDGIKLGDTTVYLYEANPALTDGIALGDTTVSLASFMSLVTDGIKLGEGHKVSYQSDAFQNNAFQITGEPYYIYEICPVATDGITLGDTTVYLFEINPALTDGIKLGDTTIRELAAALIRLTLKARDLGLSLWRR